MKKLIISFLLLSITPLCSSAEKITKLEVFGRSQALPSYCEIVRSEKNEDFQISCIPRNYKFLVGIDVLKSHDCKKEILDSEKRESNLNRNELVNTTINGLWHYEASRYNPKSKITIYQRILNKGKNCVIFLSNKEDVLDTFSGALWY